ncbi:MAG: hypothetical protein DRI89_09200 [Bacteroidetes bacterium]|nr:MAG: hypothetical protein DRI89_09200 [Bacteroidota bacterium]
MELPELREELHEYINQADENALKIIYEMSKEFKKEEIVGCRPDGTSITQQDLIDRVKLASQQVKAGNYITQEELEKEIENW